MKQDNKWSAKKIFSTVKTVLKDSIAWRLAVRQKFGATSFTLPVILVLLITLIVPHLVLIAVLIALIAGYRLSFEKR